MQTKFLHISFVLLLTFIFPSVFGQEKDSTTLHSIKVEGALKNKFEYATNTNMSRFSVRNSRIGISGDIQSIYAYRAQVELSDEGQFKVLDLSASLKPIDGLTFTLGQTSIPLFNSYVVSPSEMMFANRTFLGKYFLSTRDLGVLMRYNCRVMDIPTRLEFGLYNGNTINNPVWTSNPSYGGRVTIGNMQGLRFSAKAYNYPKDETTHFLLYGADLRFESNNWKVETEIMKKDSRTEHNSDLLSYYIQGAYRQPINTKLFEYLQPALRWDAIDENMDKNGFDVKRITTGVDFGLNRDSFASILRINYEWYFVKNSMQIFSESGMDSDKITIELLFTF